MVIIISRTRCWPNLLAQREHHNHTTLWPRCHLPMSTESSVLIRSPVTVLPIRGGCIFLSIFSWSVTCNVPRQCIASRTLAEVDKGRGEGTHYRLQCIKCIQKCYGKNKTRLSYLLALRLVEHLEFAFKLIRTDEGLSPSLQTEIAPNCLMAGGGSAQKRYGLWKYENVGAHTDQITAFLARQCAHLSTVANTTQSVSTPSVLCASRSQTVWPNGTTEVTSVVIIACGDGANRQENSLKQVN